MKKQRIRKKVFNKLHKIIYTVSTLYYFIFFTRYLTILSLNLLLSYFSLFDLKLFVSTLSLTNLIGSLVIMLNHIIFLLLAPHMVFLVLIMAHNELFYNIFINHFFWFERYFIFCSIFYTLTCQRHIRINNYLDSLVLLFKIINISSLSNI